MMMGPFIYSASSVAVAADFDGPNALKQVWAAAALPMIGGKYTATENGPTGHPVLSFKEAKAEVEGKKISDEEYETTNTVIVTDLNVLNGKLTANKIEVSLKSTFAKKNAKEELTVDVEPNPYQVLMIDDKTLPEKDRDFSDVYLEAVLAKSAGSKDHDKFCKEDLPQVRPNKHHIHKKKRKTAFTYLSKDPKDRLQSTKTEHGYRDVDFGRVYFAEWASEEDWQGLVGLRIVLNSSPAGKGEIVIADWLGNNGQFYP